VKPVLAIFAGMIRCAARNTLMNKRFFPLALAAVWVVQGAAARAPAPRVVDLTAPDRTTLKTTYLAASKPGPGVMLFHQCNRDRKMWEELAPRLVAAGG
jgi:hypothetical protein